LLPNIDLHMSKELVTKDDLDEFREKLFQDIKVFFGGTLEKPKKWIKSYQVRNLLKISDGTLQNLRLNGTIKFTKIGGILITNTTTL
jgi:hypothetical protein